MPVTPYCATSPNGTAAASRTMNSVVRLGGGEFVVLLPFTDLEGAEVVGRWLLEVVAPQVEDVDGMPIRHTVSASIAMMDRSTAALDAVMKHADAALYVAEANDRHRVERWTDEVADTSGMAIVALS